MKTYIENFIIDQSAKGLNLSYSRSVKDSIFIAFSIIWILVCFTVSIYLLFRISTSEFSWIEFIICVIFSFAGVIQLDRIYSSLKKPSKNILIWNRGDEHLTLKNSTNRTQIAISKLRGIEYQMITSIIKPDGQPIETYYIEADFVLNNGSREEIFKMELSRLITFQDPKYKEELKYKAKELITIIGDSINVLIKWKGERRVN